MLERFNGQQERLFLVEALQLQPMVGGDAVLAEAVAESSEVGLYDSGASIIEESAFDNDMYFILAGVASIRVSGREIAVRTAGQHVGEMALLDPGQPRSAAAVADGKVVMARIPVVAELRTAGQVGAEGQACVGGLDQPALRRKGQLLLGGVLGNRGGGVDGTGG